MILLINKMIKAKWDLNIKKLNFISLIWFFLKFDVENFDFENLKREIEKLNENIIKEIIKKIMK